MTTYDPFNKPVLLRPVESGCLAPQKLVHFACQGSIKVIVRRRVVNGSAEEAQC